MGKYDHYELQGTERQQALALIHIQIEGWGLTMPDVEPIPLDFGLKNFYEVGETEYWVANETQLGYCGKFLFVFDGQTCPFHRHKMKHETFFIVKGSIQMHTDEAITEMHAGDSLVMPPGIGHSFTGVGPALILEVSMPSILADNFFEDMRIGDQGII